MQYSGYLVTAGKLGMLFDTNINKDPLKVTVGNGEVVKGWEEGLLGMKRGGSRAIVVPSGLGFGKNGSPPTIPPNAMLVFEVSFLALLYFI